MNVKRFNWYIAIGTNQPTNKQKEYAYKIKKSQMKIDMH